jgi:sterol desaturase/sphingolipid hydroxylase (fatty acid hydroxylase superfamily)
MDHHVTQYPKDDLFSTQYRHSDFTAFTFEHIIAGYIVATAILLYWWCPLWVPITFLVESGLLSALHVYIHEAFHIEGTFMERVPGFDWYRHLHVIHHYNMQKNLGIVWFAWDRLFGTYKREINDDKK